MTIEQATEQLKRFMGNDRFSFTVTSDGDKWVAQCKQVDGIITCGTGFDFDEMQNLMQDAILTAAGIPNEFSEVLLKRVKRQWTLEEVPSTNPNEKLFPSIYKMENSYAGMGQI